MRHLKSAVLAFLIVLPACSGDDATPAEAAPTEDPAGTTDGTVGATTGVDETPEPTTGTAETPVVACGTASATGAVNTDGGWIVFQNHTFSVEAEHGVDSGCVNDLVLRYEVDGGCQMMLHFRGTNPLDEWHLKDGTFTADAKCGEFWTGDPQEFSLDVSSIGGIIGVPAVTAADAPGCAKVEQAQVVGKLLWSAPTVGEAGTTYFNMSLDQLGFAGDVATGAGPLAQCPKATTLCRDAICGTDPFGTACGQCGDGFTCAGGACVEGGCLTVGDGTGLGFHIADESWGTNDGGTFTLHDTCEDGGATWMIRTAGWCYWCWELREEFQAMYDKYAPLGVRFVLVIGQDLNFNPITTVEADKYKNGHGYQDGWHALVDPNFLKIEALVDWKSGGTPSHVILDQDMILRFEGAASSFLQGPENALKAILTQQGHTLPADE